MVSRDSCSAKRRLDSSWMNFETQKRGFHAMVLSSSTGPGRIPSCSSEAMRRPDYAGANDLLAMQRAVQRTWSAGSRWHVGDLAWGRHAAPGREPDWRTALWEDGDGAEPFAWGWIQLPGHLDLYVDPAHPQLAAAVLAWFEE